MDVGTVLRRRPVAGSGWIAWRAAVGLAYLAAAGFNLAYTLPHPDDAPVLRAVHR